MLNKEEMAALEGTIRSALLARKKDLAMSDEAIGQRAFQFMKNPSGKVQALLVGQGAGENRKPQTMKIGDALNLCEALGLQWVDVLRQAVKDAKKK